MKAQYANIAADRPHLFASNQSKRFQVDTFAVFNRTLNQSTNKRLTETCGLIENISRDHISHIKNINTKTSTQLTSAAKQMSALNWRIPSVGRSGKGLMMSPDTITTTLVSPIDTSASLRLSSLDKCIHV